MQMLEIAAAATACLAIDAHCQVDTGFHLAGALHWDACDDDSVRTSRQLRNVKEHSNAFRPQVILCIPTK